MKKRILTAIFSAFIAMSLVACGNSGTTTSQNTNVTSEAETVETQAEESEPTEEKAAIDEGDLGDYHVKLKGAKTCEDYEGKPAIIVSYEWTNNSEETTSPLGSMYPQAFQDGVELEVAIVDFSYEDGLNQVRPGTTITAESIFTMTSDSAVEFEISALSDIFNTDAVKLTAEYIPSELEER